MFLLIYLLTMVRCIKLPLKTEYDQIEALEIMSEDTMSEQQLKKAQTNQVFFLEIADYLEGTSFYNFLGIYASELDLQNKDNQSKRIIMATVLSILLIVVFCVVIQFILDLSKKCKIKLNRESVPIQA
ncbi:unnamed protein product (macronuclear) [Paramecium tetraurelia]|uniref:GOLD domain-containing protein n=1 Tax=Paramecium tetraurelia TaxID=5888 RepID=A0E282_PARTE|nr:uncharacterized protein GSPATT00022571001 [Paramecium tetraurelia]CAK89399.1 unnamed protein product [Paramecium tetraurelia]|eukprot:XP_001456796.1 hypothetical protein (macronuclear) [Paramecium tetraurelia strain d4-2]